MEEHSQGKQERDWYPIILQEHTYWHNDFSLDLTC